MRVLDILTLMGTLSVSNDNITPTERAIFLQYLNLAHLELYQETANVNPDLILQENLETGEGYEANTVTLSQTPYLVMDVWDRRHRCSLPRLSVGIEGGQIDPIMESNSPKGYYARGGRLFLLPPTSESLYVTAWYTPQPSVLTEATEETDIPYPVAYHATLVDGALYYLFHDEGGFKSASKEVEAKKRWDVGKSKLLSYLYSSACPSFSTFSNA